MTLNLGARIDRYRAFSPEQGHPVSRFNPTAQTFAAIDNIHLVEPAGASPRHDLRPVRRRQDGVEGQLRKSYWNPGADFVFNIQPECFGVVEALSLDRFNNNNRWEPGEEVGAPTSTARRRRDRVARSEPREQYTKEFATFLERELMPNFGVRAGYVCRGQRNQYARVNIDSSVLRVHRAGLGAGSGARWHASAPPTMAAAIAAFDLAQEFRGLTPVNQTDQRARRATPTIHTFEITGTKRMSNRWSLLASYGWTKSFDQAGTIAGQRGPRQRAGR